MAIEIEDTNDEIKVSENLTPNTISDTTEVVNVSENGDDDVIVSEVIDGIEIVDRSDVDNVTVNENNDVIDIKFQEVAQSITNNITNDNSVFTGVAATDLGGHRIVVSLGSQIAYADNTDSSHSSIVTGITTQAVLSGNPVNITISGEVSEGTWNWILDKPIFLTANGLMTQTVPPSGFLLQVGFPTSATSMVIDIKTAIILSV